MVELTTSKIVFNKDGSLRTKNNQEKRYNFFMEHQERWEQPAKDD